MSKPKKCKGTGKAINNGCGNPCTPHKFGLCLNCFKEWLFRTDSGQAFLKSNNLRAKKHVQKEQRQQEVKKREENRSKSYYEGKLQTEINHIVRLIDSDKGCISCEHGWKANFTRQAQAGHRISRGSNATLKFNVFNIYKQCTICNKDLHGNERNYDKGILSHYGQETLDLIQGLTAKYPSLHLSIAELKSAIEISRLIVSEIISGKDFTREDVNRKIGIY